MSNPSPDFIEAFDLEQVCPPVFYRSSAEIAEDAGRPPYSHLMRQAWESMGLNGIFCVDHKPTVYFKQVKQADSDKIHVFCQQFWNQGIAALLVLITPKEALVYSGMNLPAGDQEEAEGKRHLIQILDRAKDKATLRQFMEQVETGQIYRDNRMHFRQGNAVDRHLLDNLRTIRDHLVRESLTGSHEKAPSATLKILLDRLLKKQQYEEIEQAYKTVHIFLGRLLFVCYLEDRKIIDRGLFIRVGAKGADNLQELFTCSPPGRARDAFYKLFEQLQADFDGNLFEEMPERNSISIRHIKVLKAAFEGKTPDGKILPFGFRFFDFSLIPVETLCAVWDNLLAAEAAEGRPAWSVYLAGMLADIALADWKSPLEKKILDPACGAGMMPVTLFNRLAEEWRRNHLRAKGRLNALFTIMQTQLCAIDSDETACRVACMNLYLALLNQFSAKDVQKLRKQAGAPLAKLLLVKKDGNKAVKRPVVYTDNFFASELPLPASFDLVIGGLPWMGRGGTDEPEARNWYLSEEKNPFLAGTRPNLRIRELYFLPGRQAVHTFLWKAPTHLKTNGKVCLLLPSKVFFGNTDPFQASWFARITMEKLMPLSDMRFILFENASCSPVIAQYRPGKPANGDHSLDYIVPKADRCDPRTGAVTIFPEDYKKVRQAELIAVNQESDTASAENSDPGLPENKILPTIPANQTAPLIWRKHFQGRPRDVKLLNRLLCLPCLGKMIGTLKKPKRWASGQGFQPDTSGTSKRPQKPWWNRKHLYINARSDIIDLLLLKGDCEEIGDKYPVLHRPRAPAIFKAPLVLANQGFSKFAFTDFDVLFRHSLQSISGPEEDAELLMLLAAVLRSKLARYFIFHTSANWGIERDKVQFFELMRLPFPLPEATRDPEKSQAIIQQIATEMRHLKRSLTRAKSKRDEKIAESARTMEALVYDYYDITEQEQRLIEDTVKIYEQSASPQSLASNAPAFKNSSSKERETYANLLCKTLYDLDNTFRVNAHINVSEPSGLGTVTLQHASSEPCTESSAPDELQSVLETVRKRMPADKRRFSHLRSAKCFAKDKLYIVKSLELRHWTQTAALHDADEIAAAALTEEKGMNAVGDAVQWAASFSKELIPQILELVVEAWRGFQKKPEPYEAEVPLSLRLAEQLSTEIKQRGLPLIVRPQESAIESGKRPETTVHIDVLLNAANAKEQELCFTFECRRLRTPYQDRAYSSAMKYTGKEGMMRFIAGEHGNSLTVGGMIGYVMDGNLKPALKQLKNALDKNRADLCMNPKTDLSSSSESKEKTVKETKHTVSGREFTIYHILLPVEGF
ncbi:MAG: hypothetical protein GY862_35960 [Gammaproteobacteria bacterium]|nr:hypothetical protein [Gammaproteobacteria bacterium]